MSAIKLFPGERLDRLTVRQIEYREFLATPLWETLRRECYRLAGWACVKCGAAGRELNAHHKRYPEKFEDTRQGDLLCICRECHEKEHGVVTQPVIARAFGAAPESSAMCALHQLRARGRIDKRTFRTLREHIRLNPNATPVEVHMMAMKPIRKRRHRGKRSNRTMRGWRSRQTIQG